MNGPDGFDRLITTWLDELAPMREPDGLLETVTGQIQRTRRRPGWALLERWLPMQTRAKFGAIPRTAIILVTLGILAMLLTAVAIGAQPSAKSDLAPLFGVAGNGRIFSTQDGDIYVTDPGSSVPRPFVTSSQTELYPTMTNDGGHVLFQRNDGDTSQIMIAAADGSDEPRALSPQAWTTVGDWWPSPDGKLVVVIAPGGAQDSFGILPVNGDAPWMVPIGRTAQGVLWETDGQHLQFITYEDRPGAEIYRVPTAGGPVTLVSYLPGGVHWLNVSPDGTRMAYGTLDEPCCNNNGLFKVWVANVDGTDARRVTESTGDTWEDGGFWSPDGKHLAITTGYGIDFQVAIVPVDEGGTTVLSHPISLSKPIYRSSDPNKTEGIHLEWAPDGTSLQVWRDADPGLMSIDAATGATTELPWTSTDWPVWQRLAT